jgi:hypothetical protein
MNVYTLFDPSVFVVSAMVGISIDRAFKVDYPILFPYFVFGMTTVNDPYRRSFFIGTLGYLISTFVNRNYLIDVRSNIGKK